MKKPFLLLSFVLAAIGAGAGVTPFRDGETVVFLGDSITHGGRYVADLQLLWSLRHPGSGVVFHNAGINGQRANHGNLRYDWDVAPLKPDRVFIMFGMNDVARDDRWAPPETPEKLKRRTDLTHTYVTNLTALVRKVRASGATPVVITPTPFDQYSAMTNVVNSPGSDDPGLKSFAAKAREVAAVEKAEVVEFYDELLPILKAHPEKRFLRDRVHPGHEGHLLMASLVLKAMGETEGVGEAIFDASAGARTFLYVPKRLPYPTCREYAVADSVMPLSETWNRELLHVTGLPSGRWTLRLGGTDFGTFTAEELAAGVNVTTTDAKRFSPSLRTAEKAWSVLSSFHSEQHGLRVLAQTFCQVRRLGGDVNSLDSCLEKYHEWIDVYRRTPSLVKYYKYYGDQIPAFKAKFLDRENALARIEKGRAALAAFRPAAYEVSVTRSDGGRVVVDFRDETLTLEGASGAFTVESRKAPGRVYARGVLKGFPEVTRVDRVCKRTDREHVVVTGATGGATNVLAITAGYDGVTLNLPEGASVAGTFITDAPPGDDVFAVAADRRPTGLEAACGPAVPAHADSVFCRRWDGLLSVAGATLDYAADARCYRFAGKGKVRFSCRKGFLADRCHVNYRPVNPHGDLKTPPVGWMTWYAVKFDACDAVVMRNARSFMRHFRGYTDERPVLWVDWEWYHEKMGSCGADGQDVLTPRANAYPRGLKAVADDLKALGFRPALWVSFVNDVTTNALWKAHPEWILCEQKNWSGAIWGNPTSPGFCEEYIPALVKRYRDDWGYEAFKWDTLPNANWIFSHHRDRFADPTANSADVFRKMVAAGRKAFGPNVYLESCAGLSDRDILEAIDLFDAARVGDDIFDWECFLKGGVNRILQFYPLHGTVFWADADNLVLREEFSTLAQARTRVTVYGLAGVPITLGDDFSKLDAPRIEMLRRVMPVVPTHPAALGSGNCPTKDLDLTVDVARDFGTWQLRAWSNLATNKARRVSFAAPGKIVWDFWNDRLLTEESFEIAPGDTRLVRVTPVAKAGPTLVSVSRHLTQGAYELKEYAADAQGVRGVVRCPGGETVKLTFLLGEGATVREASHPYDLDGRILRLKVGSDGRADVPFALKLRKEE